MVCKLTTLMAYLGPSSVSQGAWSYVAGHPPVPDHQYDIRRLMQPPVAD